MEAEFQKIKRFHLSIATRQTQKMLTGLCVFGFLVLFLSQLFLMNHLSSAGYMLTREITKKSKLLTEVERLNVEIAKNETQEFVTKITEKKYEMVVKDNQKFVYIPLRMTAQK